MAKPREKPIQEKPITETTKRGRSPAVDGMLTRRAVLQSVVVASAAAAFAPTGVASGTAGDQTRRLARTETALLTRVLDRLIPSAGVMPGAGEVGVTQFIDDLVVDAPHLRPPIVDILGSVGAATPAPVTDEQMDAALHRAELESPEAFGMLVHATYTGYYCHPEVLDAIGWVSPDANPNEPEPFDDSRLVAVRRRGPIYKQA